MRQSARAAVPEWSADGMGRLLFAMNMFIREQKLYEGAPMPVNCVLCFRDDTGSYYKNAYVTLISIFENTRESVAVHILHDETITHGQADIQELCQRYGHTVSFYRVPVLDDETVKAITKVYSIGATYRYYIHELVDADKAVYLDCDIVVNRDINDLYSVSLHDKLAAAVPDIHSYWKDNGKPKTKYKKMVDYLGLKPERYINTGVMLLNLKKLRQITNGQNLFIKKTIHSVRDNIPCYYPDMEIINSVINSIPDSLILLDQRFNCWHGCWHLSLDELNDTIFHFVLKPDTHFYPAHLLFWKYYAKTPFSSDMFERMSNAYAAPAMDFVRYYCLNPAQRNHAKDLLQYGVIGGFIQTLKRKLHKRSADSSL